MADGLAREGFDLDLSFGEERERVLARALGDCHFEAKSDQKVRRTGFVFIETHQRPRGGEWRPSGIQTSRAGWFALEVWDERWILIRRTALKAYAKQSQAVHGGDENRYRGRLVPIEWLIKPWRAV